MSRPQADLMELEPCQEMGAPSPAPVHPLPRGPQGAADTSYVNTAAPQYGACLLNKELFEAFRLFLVDKNMGHENDWIHFTGMKIRNLIFKIRCSDSARVILWTFVHESRNLFSQKTIEILRKESRYSIHRQQDSDTQILEGF